MSKREYSKEHRLRRPEKVVPRRSLVDERVRLVSPQKAPTLKRSLTTSGAPVSRIKDYSPPAKLQRSVTIGSVIKKDGNDIATGDTPEVVVAPTRPKEI
jgi:hypothetical protein